jgi:histidine triad (HIT) family protein
MMECAFCSILQGRLPASMVYEDDRVSAFMDIRPLNKGHVLVVPRTHAADLVEMSTDDGGRVFRVAQMIAGAMRHRGVDGVACEGINLWLADGKAAGQEVFHVHLHVVPRSKDDGFGLKFPPDYGHQPSRAELDEIAHKIKAELANAPH